MSESSPLAPRRSEANAESQPSQSLTSQPREPEPQASKSPTSPRESEPQASKSPTPPREPESQGFQSLTSQPREPEPQGSQSLTSQPRESEPQAFQSLTSQPREPEPQGSQSLTSQPREPEPPVDEVMGAGEEVPTAERNVYADLEAQIVQLRDALNAKKAESLQYGRELQAANESEAAARRRIDDAAANEAALTPVEARTIELEQQLPAASDIDGLTMNVEDFVLALNGCTAQLQELLSRETPTERDQATRSTIVRLFGRELHLLEKIRDHFEGIKREQEHHVKRGTYVRQPPTGRGDIGKKAQHIRQTTLCQKIVSLKKEVDEMRLAASAATRQRRELEKDGHRKISALMETLADEEGFARRLQEEKAELQEEHNELVVFRADVHALATEVTQYKRTKRGE